MPPRGDDDLCHQGGGPELPRFGKRRSPSGTWTDPIANHVRLADYANNWLDTRPDLRPRTVELYRRRLDKQVLPGLRTTMIAELSPSTVRTWHAGLAAERPSTAAKAYRLLATIMNTALADDLVLRSPCRVKGAGIERAPERPIPTIAEVGELAAAMPDRMAMIVAFAAWCQARRGEVLGLRRRDVDLVQGVLVIEQTVQHFTDGRIVFGPPKTPASRRRVVVPPHLTPALAAHLDRFVETYPDAPSSTCMTCATPERHGRRPPGPRPPSSWRDSGTPARVPH